MAIESSMVVPFIELMTSSAIGSETAANADLFVFLLVGLLAGAHCLGMCGPLVTAYSDRMTVDKNDPRRDNALSWFEVRQHGLFNLGRTVSYAFIGGLFGLVGGAAFATIDAVTLVGDSVRGGLGILVGIAIVTSGIHYILGRSGVPNAGVPIIGALFRRVSKLIGSRIDGLASSRGIVALGALHGLLPCPIIYPAYLYAFAVGNPIRGALSLAVLGLGTIPTLFLYGTLMTSISTSNRIRLHRALGVSFLLLGYIPLSHGLMLFGIHLPHPPLPFYQPL